MRQQNDKISQNSLTRARKKLFNNNNIDILNNRIASSIQINNVNKNIVII